MTGDGEIENQYLEDALRVLGHNPKDDEIAAFRAKQFASVNKTSRTVYCVSLYKFIVFQDERIKTITFPDFLVILNKRRQDALTNRVRSKLEVLMVKFRRRLRDLLAGHVA